MEMYAIAWRFSLTEAGGMVMRYSRTCLQHSALTCSASFGRDSACRDAATQYSLIRIREGQDFL